MLFRSVLSNDPAAIIFCELTKKYLIGIFILPSMSLSMLPVSRGGGVDKIACTLSFEAVADAMILLIKPIVITGNTSITT